MSQIDVNEIFHCGIKRQRVNQLDYDTSKITAQFETPNKKIRKFSDMD